MKKPASKDLPSNMKTSRQNIDEVGRTSQGAPRKLTERERKFLKAAQLKKTKKKGYSLKDAMKALNDHDEDD